ncbi:hypothetical protein BB8028_0007g00050 [Beauveria bassiana]|uniref:2EXR domain-containing protein n=1 Tax=Beauveria bassiana TaxID=176275 RepID=A0A2S7YKT7_BEABA|nr:hypothetical protein BB8028_0007g00050 [Beauveria bassiana]
MLLQYFPQFPLLPAEIRSYIWRLALRQPRLHRLNEPFLLQPTETLLRSTVTCRTILATFQESRVEALRALPNVLPLGHSFLHFNVQENVICLVQLSLSMLDAANAAATKFLAQEYSGARSVTPIGLGGILQGFMQVKSLALEVRNTSFDTSLGFLLSRDMDHLAHFVS